MWKSKKVVVTGGSGFLGSYLVGKLNEKECIPFVPRSNEFDLRKQTDIKKMLDSAGDIDILFHLAANVGGIGYNQAHGYDLYYDNMCMGLHLIDLAIKHGVKKFVQIGTVCAYPKFTPVPFDERWLWDGYPEETNAPYGLAKRMALVQLEEARKKFGFNGVYVLPTNLYGPKDNFNPDQSHVIPAIIKKFVEAKDEVEIWGSGEASRDFLYVTDAVEGILMIAEKWDSSDPINLGTGIATKISVLVHMIAKLVGYKGNVRWNTSKPDGQPNRALRIWRAKDLGWEPKINLEQGLKKTIEWYKKNAV